MPVEYTPAVARALEAAQDEARRQCAAAVEPPHLLHALLREEEGRAWLLLVQAGVDPARLREFIGPESAEVPPPGEKLPLGAEARAILARSHELAWDLAADGTLPSELVLLAMLEANEALRSQLEQRGLDFSQAREAVLAAQGPPLRMEEPLCLREGPEQIDAGRILDANANRAREALRVVEDYCRFVLDDALLSAELKQLRHELTETLAGVSPQLLLTARDTPGDVGTALSTASEKERHSLAAVVQANCKRLQEALRTLEEVGKLRSPDLGERLERLRYKAYTLERAVILAESAGRCLADARLYVLLTAAQCLLGLERTIREAAAGGAQVFQLREKGLADRDLLERARQVRRWTRQAGALFLVNDRPDIARLAEADGVHLGQEDMTVRDARRILGPDAVVGLSTHELCQLRQAALDGATYVGVGPTFPSETKSFVHFPGLESVRQATAATTLPAFAIGGITVANLPDVLAAGARRVAVSRAVCQAESPEAAAAALRQLLDRA
jgi:thiamine-phosphate pyrophosphorylase